MKYFNRYLFIGLFCVSCGFNSVSCTDSVYERISPYVQDSDTIVDPHSLYYNRISQTVKAPRTYRNVEVVGNEMAVRHAAEYQSHCKDGSYEVFARRLINMLVSKSNLKISGEIAVGQVDLEATVDELELLRAFGDGRLSIRQIDDIISNVIRPVQISLFDQALNYTDKLSIYIYQHRVLFGAMLLTFFVLIIALKVKWTRLRIIFLIVDIMVIISFMLTWWELLQEAEIKLTVQQRIYSRMPDECQQDKISFMRSVWLFFGFGRGDCLKYYEAVMTDPVLKVTPLHAFSHMTTKFFFHPMAVAATYLSKFIQEMTGQLPFPLNHIATVLLVLFMPTLFTLLLFVVLGASMGIRVGPFFHLYLHGRQSTPPPNSLAHNDRQAIEVIRADTNASAITASETRPAAPVAKATPKKVKASTQTDESKQKPQEPKNREIEKPEESDTNSDEFPEEKEYEKISRRKLEDEMKQSDNVESVDNSSSQKEKEQKASESGAKNKTCLEVGGGDN